MREAHDSEPLHGACHICELEPQGRVVVTDHMHGDEEWQNPKLLCSGCIVAALVALEPGLVAD